MEESLRRNPNPELESSFLNSLFQGLVQKETLLKRVLSPSSGLGVFSRGLIGVLEGRRRLCWKRLLSGWLDLTEAAGCGYCASCGCLGSEGGIQDWWLNPLGRLCLHLRIWP